MAYLSLYRKYRSQSFGDLVGQGHVVKTLQAGIASGRIAQSYLFTGPRGTGKTSTARLLAKALCCEKGPVAEPCNECSICKAITEGSCMDVTEMDAASEAGVEQVRDAIVNVTEFQPAQARYKVFIVDEVHDLSSKAFDALLKTIEEPPPHVVFVLATTEYPKVPATIRSRCQKFEFHRATMSDLKSRIEYVAQAEGVDIEPSAVNGIARMADGGFRDALTLLEQAIMTSNGPVTLQHVYDQLGLIPDEIADQMLAAIKGSKVPDVVILCDQVIRLGRDPKSILESLLYRLADMTRAAYGVATLDGESAQEAALHAAASGLGIDTVLWLRSELSEIYKAIKDVTLPRLWLESQLVRLCTPTAVRQPTQHVRQPAVDPPAPAPKKDVPEPKKEVPNAEPVSQPPVAAKPAPPKVASISDPAEAWKVVVGELGEQSKLMRMRLASSRVAGVRGDKVVVEFGRQMDLDWILEGTRRQRAIQEAFSNTFVDQKQLEFVSAKRTEGSDNGDAQTVELAAEGDRLVQIVKDILVDGESAEPNNEATS